MIDFIRTLQETYYPKTSALNCSSPAKEKQTACGSLTPQKAMLYY